MSERASERETTSCHALVLVPQALHKALVRTRLC